jgi:hypothetical protein
LLRGCVQGTCLARRTKPDCIPRRPALCIYTLEIHPTKNWFIILRHEQGRSDGEDGRMREQSVIFPLPVLRHLKSLEGQAGVANPTRKQSNIPLPCFTSRERYNMARESLLLRPGITFFARITCEKEMLLLFSGGSQSRHQQRRFCQCTLHL